MANALVNIAGIIGGAIALAWSIYERLKGVMVRQALRQWQEDHPDEPPAP